jgi:undecaprenyl-diphosphatase
MTYSQSIISGIIQGITEFLPVSSSGHLVILHHYFGYKEPQILFDLLLHIGTLFAVFVYFWRDIINMITGQRRLLLYIIIGSIPTAVIGVLFKDIFESLFSNIKAVGLMLFVTAGFLFLGEWASNRKKTAPDNGLGWLKAIVIGIVQGIAITPGISRSGSTIAAGLTLGLDKKEAVRFSFLLGIPAIIGASLFKLSDAGSNLTITSQMLAGTIVAFFIGLGAIYLLIKMVTNGKLRLFGIYCIILGSAVLVL